MDNQEAIKTLRELRRETNDSWYEAVYDMAISALEAEPCEDAVSRHRLLSDLEELIVAWEKYPVMAEQRKGVEAAIGYVKTIPSAQPEIVRCKDCKLFGNSEQLPSAQPEQSIAEWQKDFREYINMLNIPRDDYKGIMEYINEVPSAQPELRRGEES